MFEDFAYDIQVKLLSSSFFKFMMFIALALCKVLVKVVEVHERVGCSHFSPLAQN